MTTFFLAFIIIAVVIAGMSIGVMFGRERIRGSCGGANNGACLCIRKCARKRVVEGIPEVR